MTYQEEMYAHLVHGGDPQVLLDAFMKDLNEAQKKADEQLTKEKEQAAARAAKKRDEEARKETKKKAVAAFADYLTLVLGDQENLAEFEELVGEAFDSLEDTIKMLKGWKITVNGKPLNLLDL